MNHVAYIFVLVPQIRQPIKPYERISGLDPQYSVSVDRFVKLINLPFIDSSKRHWNNHLRIHICISWAQNVSIKVTESTDNTGRFW